MPQADGSVRPQRLWRPGSRCLTPPPMAYHEPMHWDLVRRARDGMGPVPKKARGEFYS